MRQWSRGVWGVGKDQVSFPLQWQRPLPTAVNWEDLTSEFFSRFSAIDPKLNPWVRSWLFIWDLQGLILQAKSEPRWLRKTQRAPTWEQFLPRTFPCSFNRLGQLCQVWFQRKLGKKLQPRLSSFLWRTSGAFAIGRIAERKGFYKAQSWPSVCPAFLLPRMCPLPPWVTPWMRRKDCLGQRGQKSRSWLFRAVVLWSFVRGSASICHL